MKQTKTLLLFLLCGLLSGCYSIRPSSVSVAPVSHDSWTALLQKHVNQNGFVDYNGFIADSNELNFYIQTLQNNPPNTETWSRNDILAYWINAYNAFTVQIVIRNYPTASIKDIKPGIGFINSVWDIKFIEIAGLQLDLNNIEHNILRKMDEPRIHFAINCASYSCPVLGRNAYTAKQLDMQLDEAARLFVNDPTRNHISDTSAAISSIFNWFTGDFTKNGSLTEFINQYSTTRIPPEVRITFLPYDWRLNSQ